MPWVLAMLIALLVYIYTGYPVLIWVLSRVRGRPVRKGRVAVGVTVLIAAHNEAEALPRKLRQLLDLARREPIREIRIGLDGCTDGSAEALRGALAASGEGDAAGGAAPEVRILEFPERRGKAAVLNDLMETAGQPILVLMDARQRVEEGAISRLLENFADETVGVVSGELVYQSATGGAQKGAQSYWGYEKFIRSCESRFWAVPGATGALYAIRRECCDKIPENTLVDDVLIPMKAVLRGFRCIFEPSARVFDLPAGDFASEVRRKRRTLAGIWQIGRLEPKIYGIWTNPIWFQWISHKFLRLLTPFLVILGLFLAGGMEFRQGWAVGGAWAWWSVVFWGGLAGLVVSGLAFWAGRRVRSRLVGLLGAFWGVNWALVQAAGDAWTGRFEPKWKR
jgi:cellulose synthase/poly-beta-1,6-N-acetylglucosamine synthase-like glycosyltransferase